MGCFAQSSVRLAFLLAFLSVDGSAWGCPAFLFSSDLGGGLSGRRQELRLFIKTGAGFREQAIEVNPVDHDGHLVFFRDLAWREEIIRPNDLLLFRTDHWGSRIDLRRERLPCQGPSIIEIQEQVSGNYAYLTICKTFLNASEFSAPVHFEPTRHLLKTQSYIYRFNPENYMQFSAVSFLDRAKRATLVALDSRLYIHADVRNFFTMSFDSRDIESKMESYRIGSVGNLARISFFLKILFFRIKMSLSTDVGFFEDSAHIPMMVNIPADAPTYLNPGSGILYSWVPGPDANAIGLKMPSFDPALLVGGWKELSKIGERFCSQFLCNFRYALEVAGKRLEMDLRFERRLVERGFFPMYIEDIEKHIKSMGWQIDFPRGQMRSGMYFETSGLPKGGHPWDFWLRLGGSSGAVHACPIPLRTQIVSTQGKYKN